MKALSALVFFISVVPLLSLAEGEISSLETKVRSLKEEIRDLEKSADEIKERQRIAKSDLAMREAEFKSQFERIILPLLSWPAFSSSRRVQGWIEREDRKFILEEARGRLSREPLELVADRDLRLRRIEDSSAELKKTLEDLREKESLLSLQVEELKLLRKKSLKVQSKQPSSRRM